MSTRVRQEFLTNISLVLTRHTDHSHPKYRSDVDGLRAIAVLSVIGFHAFPEWISGGFVGVDIFFVISGYLISSIIMNCLDNGSFSFSQFYARRVRRIFPALILLMIFCLGFGWFALLPGEFQQLGKHVAAGAAFVSNITFWQEAGYFDKSAEVKPLLHLWSLGVEEQFYIVYPMVLYIAYRHRPSVSALLVSITIISFCINIGTITEDPTQVFYSPLTRFWELTAGGILAFTAVKAGNCGIPFGNLLEATFGRFAGQTPTKSSTSGNVQSIIGALLLGVAILFVNKDRAFPGWWALLPTTGAYLLISAGQFALLNRYILSNRHLVRIGVISYPLYLWHWPLLSLAWILESQTPSIPIRLIAIVLAFALALLTYHMVEVPIRYGNNGRIKVLILAALMALLAAIGLGICASSIEMYEVKRGTSAEGEASTLNPQWTQCSFQASKESFCMTFDLSKPPEIALIGDSHARHLTEGLLNAKTKMNKNVMIAGGGDCLPFFEDIEKVNFPSVCDGRLINRALEQAMASQSIQTIILSGYGVAKIQGRGESTNTAEGYANNPSTEEIRQNATTFRRAMFTTLERLVNSGKRVVFIADVPEMNFNPRDCVKRPVRLPGHKLRTQCAVPRQEFEARNLYYHRIIAEAKAYFPTVKFIDAYKYFCDSIWCHGVIDGELLYRDRDHLSPAGSRFLVDKIREQLIYQ